MRIPSRRPFKEFNTAGLRPEEIIREIAHRDLKCYVRSTRVSGKRISDGIIIFDGSSALAAYFEDDGEAVYREEALSKTLKLMQRKSAVTDIFLISEPQMRLALRGNEKTLLKKPIEFGIPIETGLHLEGVLEEEKGFGLLDVPPELIQEKAMEEVLKKRGGRKFTKREIMEYGEVIYGTEKQKVVMEELMKKYGITREDLLKKYRLSEPTEDLIDRLMANFFDVGEDGYAGFKKEVCDMIVEGVSDINGVKKVECFINFPFDADIRVKYPELMVDVSYAEDSLRELDAEEKTKIKKKIEKVSKKALDKALKYRDIDIHPEKKKIVAELHEEIEDERAVIPSQKFITGLRSQLLGIFKEAMANHILQWCLKDIGAYPENITREQAKRLIEKLKQDVVVHRGFEEGEILYQKMEKLIGEELG